MAELPGGTVTLVFTDIEGSTRLLESLGERYGEVLAEHRILLREAFTAHGGVEVDTQGDALFYAFPRAQDATMAAMESQRVLASHPWPANAEVRVRMGIHTGEPQTSSEGYVGPDVHRAARICAAAHGGQVLLSQATQVLIDDSSLDGARLNDLGEHALKDISARVHLYELVIEGLPSDFPPVRTLDAHLTNLPPFPTALVGREAEMTKLATSLRGEGTRLITLTGPGGTGKTRLALEVAHELLEDFSDGVFVVDLSPVTYASLVVAQIAAALSLRESGGRPLQETLHDYLASKEMLLVIDNFEQVMDAASEVASLLSSAPDVRVLVTSREPLRIVGEQEFAVPPLSLPSSSSPRLEDAKHSPAVALFTERARGVRADFELTEDNLAAVIAICRRLDGLPLAIELAAARIKVLSPHGLLDRLDHSLRLLSAGRRDASERQRTLRGAISWSFELLSEDEQTLFRRLGVFSGGWSLEAAEAVCDRSDLDLEVLDGLASLVDKSLVGAVQGDEERFSMLETIREFATERLEESGETEEIRRAHAEYFRGLAEEAEPYLVGEDQKEWLDRLERELPNVRTALQWSLSNDLHVAAATAAATARLWYMRGLLSEGRARLNEAIRACPPDSPQAKSKIAWMLGALAWVQGDLNAAKASAEVGAAIAQGLKDEHGFMRCIETLALCEMDEEEFDKARTHLEDNLVRSNALGDQRRISVTTGNLGRLSMLEGQYETASALMKESLKLDRQLRDKDGVATSLTNLGLSAVLMGDPQGGESCLQEAIELAWDLGHTDLLATALEGYAAVVASSRGNERAALLLGAAERIRSGSGAALDPIEFKVHQNTKEHLLRSMMESELGELMSEGAALSIDEVILHVERTTSVPE